VSIPEDLTESSKSPGKSSRPASTSYAYAALTQGPTLFPAVEVEIERDDGQVFPFRMLPDSGASASVFPLKQVVPLGFDKRECEQVPVGTGNGKGWHWLAPRPIVARIAGRALNLRPCFGNIDVAVLGREDFFAEFYVEVDERRRVVVITPHDDWACDASGSDGQ
jgi:hypothetical protein